MKRQFFLVIVLCFMPVITVLSQEPVKWESAAVPWPESFGSHRAVLEVSEPAGAVFLDLLWRRHDRETDKRRFLIVEATTGDTVTNIHRYEVGNERCRIAFGPVLKAGLYHFYYLPYLVQTGWGFYSGDYLKPENLPADSWLTVNNLSGAFDTHNGPFARLVSFESRTAFDSFYPMEVIATAAEKRVLMSRYKTDYLLFPEDRKFPIRMKDDIPYRWTRRGARTSFSGQARRNEYFTFQIGVFAAKTALKNIKVKFTALEGGPNKILPSALTCFNTGGIDPFGTPFTKTVDVEQGKIQPLWIGVDITENIPAGLYRGKVTVTPENSPPQEIDVALAISGAILEDRGDSELWRHSRLRWLNSTLGIDDQPTQPYEAILTAGDNSYKFTNKQLAFDKTGMPALIRVGETDILAGPCAFIVETARGKEVFTATGTPKKLTDGPGVKSTQWETRSGSIQMAVTTIIESDGYINYKVRIWSPVQLDVKDIRLEIPFRNDIAEYIMAMDQPGTTVHRKLRLKWKGPHDSFWVGSTEGGLWCELRGGAYHGPLMNLFRPEFPASWHNNDNGGFEFEKGPSEAKAVAFSGARILKAGESIEFEWAMLITPVKPINLKSQFTDRYYHNGGAPMPSDSDLATGVKIVNLHHANNYNPNINYPFIAVDSMKWFVNQLHEKGLKVKIYYTIRELTNYVTELWALRSLGYEILGDGVGHGFPWLREHLIDGYRPQWYQHFEGQSADASIVSAPGDSRWYNYYVEGLAWLVKNVDIDGLYLDDVSYDRRILKRMRKVMDNLKPGCLMDLHSNTGFSIGPATQYAEFFPFVDKLWFGESFRYDAMPPENWLVEVSGIPFGLMGDMLQGGGNRWRGMLYGMTVRFPWVSETKTADPRPVWKIWDEFGIAGSEMTGYWEKKCPVVTGNPKILATVYRREGQSLISVASWEEQPAKFTLKIDWGILGLDPQKATLVAPEIENFQHAAVFKPGDAISVEPGKGWLLYLTEH